MARIPISVVETPEFLTTARRLMTEDERALLVDYVAYNPMAGDLIRGTGGLRKLRWGLAGRSKRGGARVIHFYHDRSIPIFLLAAYAKSQKDDLSHDERDSFRRLTDQIVRDYRKRKPR
jgi:hypothetical protein